MRPSKQDPQARANDLMFLDRARRRVMTDTNHYSDETRDELIALYSKIIAISEKVVVSDSRRASRDSAHDAVDEITNSLRSGRLGLPTKPAAKKKKKR